MALSRTSRKSIQLKVLFSTGGTGEVKDFNFFPGNANNSKAIKYPNPSDQVINQSFKEIFVHNLSDEICVYSVLADRNDEVSLTAAGGNGQKTVPSKFAISEEVPINRLRIFLDGPGTVEVVLSK